MMTISRQLSSAEKIAVAQSSPTSIDASQTYARIPTQPAHLEVSQFLSAIRERETR